MVPRSRLSILRVFCHAPEGFLGWCRRCCVSHAMKGLECFLFCLVLLRSEGRAELVRKTTKWRSGPGSRRQAKDLAIPFRSPEAPPEKSERDGGFCRLVTMSCPLALALSLPPSFCLSVSLRLRKVVVAASALRSSSRGSEAFGSGSRASAAAVSSPRRSTSSLGISTQRTSDIARKSLETYR